MSIHSVKISQEMNILEIGAKQMDQQLFKLLLSNLISVVGSDIVQYQINQNVIREENQ